MAINNPLFVPVLVDALMVNQHVLSNKGTNVERWKYMYGLLPGFNTPAPAPFNYNANLPGTGTILHWELPSIIRNGSQDEFGAVKYPLVPNRWLVIRYNGPANARTAVAWVVQSDAIGNSDPVTGGAPYIQPNSATLQPTYVGQVVSLSNWTEPNPPELFLTAVAPGNTTFASFQPYCQNVFSIYDPLAGIPSQDILSYLIAGWYSNEGDDIVGSWQTGKGSFKEFLYKAGWEIANNTSKDSSTWAIYHSMTWGLQWDLNGPAPTNAPQPANLNISLGNTTVDALTTLIRAQAQAAGKGSTIDPDLLEALQYGLLPHYDQPDTAYELKEAIEKSWFSSLTGGYSWEIVDVPVDPSDDDPPPPISREERSIEEAWLAELNQVQETYDQNVEILAQLQWNLYQTWWKYNYFLMNPQAQYPSGTSQAQFQNALDPTLSGSLVSQVNTLMLQIQNAGASGQVPVGATQAELQTAIDNYAASKKLPATRQLKQLAKRPFTKAYDPVILIHGLGVDKGLTPYKPLVCRFLSDLVTGFNYDKSTITLAQVQTAIPVPANISAVPSQMVNLMQEFFLLDPANATMIAQAALGTTDPTVIRNIAEAMLGGKNVVGVAPDLDLDTWKQPWAPLVMLWDIVWYPIPHDNNSNVLWTFDGNDYSWDGNNLPTPVESWEYTGSIFMTPQASFNFREQVEKYIQDNPDAVNVKELNDFITQIDGWDFLSQSLAGLSQSMTLRDPHPNMSASFDPTVYYPGTMLSTLVGNSGTYVPIPGLQQPPPFQGFPPSGFQNWRAGQFYIKQLVIADRFGQLCEIVTNQTQTQLAPYLPESLTPQFPVIPNQPYRFVQLPPRILQPARLDLDFVSCSSDDFIVGLDPGINPVCAWLLHNYLDESIVTYDNSGVILGAVWVITNDTGQQVVNWVPAPGSAYATIPDLLTNPDLRKLGQMLLSVQQLGPAAFQSLIKTIDEAVWTIDSGETTSDQGLILLAGKPVALVRMRVRFEMQGAAITDPGWRFTFAPQPNPVAGYDFNIRMGEAGRRMDGLIGYFIGTNYNQLYTPHVPDHVPDPNYILDVGIGSSLRASFMESAAVFLSVLMDPRAAVHATTGILPVISIGIPTSFVGGAFANMEVTFTVGPLLTDAVQPRAGDADNRTAYTMPRPSVKNGTWSWQQADQGAWKEYGIAPINAQANFSNVNPVIREGLLRLTGAIRTYLLT